MPTDVQSETYAARAAELYASDAEFRAAEPDQTVIAAAHRPGLRLVEILETLMNGYADRPAVGRRSTSVVRDSATGRAEQQLLPSFDHRHLRPAVVRRQGDRRDLVAARRAVDAGDFVVTIGFASIDYLTVDLVCAYLGLVTVPLQHNAPASRLQPIFDETQPRVLAVSAAYLELAVQTALDSDSVRRLVVFDYDDAVDEQREALQQASSQLADRPIEIEILADVVSRGHELPAPAGFGGADDQRLAMILYTSGSTGTPKGAMWTERMVSLLWTTDFLEDTQTPVINVNFMPLNHLGRPDWSVDGVSGRRRQLLRPQERLVFPVRRLEPGAPNPAGAGAAGGRHVVPAFPDPFRPAGFRGRRYRRG